MELLACSTMTFHITGFIVSCSGVLSHWSLSKKHFHGHTDHREPHEINCLIIPIGTFGLCEKCSMCQWFVTVKKGYKEAYTIMTSYLNSIFLIHRF